MQIVYIVLPYNLHEIEQAKKLFDSEEIPITFCETLVPFLSGHKDSKKFMLTKGKFLEMLSSLRKCDVKFQVGKYTPICAAGKSTMAIECNGTVYPCMLLRHPLGNLLTQSLKEIWENALFLKILRSVKEENLIFCENCKYKNYCMFCYGYNFIWNHDYVKPYPYQCEITKIRYSMGKRQ